MFFYNLGFYASYFAVLIVFSIIAIIFAKKLYAWIFYVIGAIITLFSLIGLSKSYNSYYGDYLSKDMMMPYWTIYLVILGVCAYIIFVRYYESKQKAKENNEKDSRQSDFSEALTQIPASTTGKTWKCEKCGSQNSYNSLCCKNCGNYK